MRYSTVVASLFATVATARVAIPLRRDDHNSYNGYVEYVIDSEGDAPGDYNNKRAYNGATEGSKGARLIYNQVSMQATTFSVGGHLDLDIAGILGVGVGAAVAKTTTEGEGQGTSYECPDDASEDEFTCSLKIVPKFWQVNGHVNWHEGGSDSLIISSAPYTVFFPATSSNDDGLQKNFIELCLCPNPDNMIYPRHGSVETDCPESCGNAEDTGSLSIFKTRLPVPAVMADEGLLLQQPTLGKLRYVRAGHIPESSPYNFHLPAMSEFGDEQLVPLQSMRPLPTITELPSATSHAQLKTHGFTGVHHPTTLHTPPYDVSSWKDPELLREHYVPDTANMVKRITGCKSVLVESLLLRSATWTESDALATHAGHGEQEASTEDQAEEKELSALETGFPQFIGFNPARGGASPAPKIHLDYSPAGARAHIRKFHPLSAAAAANIVQAEDGLTATGKSLRDYYHDSEGPRWALYSIWRPLKTVKRDPLALGDPKTFETDDYLPVNVKTPCLGQSGVAQTHDSEAYVARFSERHRWHWIEEQKPEEVLVIGLFDSDAEKNGVTASGGTLHSSVDIPGTGNEEARESLELRCLCIW